MLARIADIRLEESRIIGKGRMSGREATDGRWTRIEATNALPLSERRAPPGHFRSVLDCNSPP